ncbi:MAG: choice-of-anchor A family protein, partial [Betaproteobacteria bacterium]|nr:choice-of-anchor A family protein [Betaproteobacteria bacterium]
ATVFDGLNVLVQDSFQSQFSEVQGVLAVGGNATLFNYGVDLLSTPYGGAGGYGLVVGGNLTFSSGSVGTLITNPAQTYYGGALSGSLVNYTGGFNTVNPLSFSSLFNQASVASTALAGYSSTGAATLNVGGIFGNPAGLTLTGDGSSAVQVFSISGTDLQTRNQIVVNNVPTTSTVLVNVTGTFAQLASVDSSSPFDPFGGKVLFNFKDATQVNFANTGLHASILAPNAVITSNSGHIRGVVIAKNWNGNFEVQPGAAPLLLAVPEPETYAMMLAGLGLLGFVARRRGKRPERAAA